MKPSKHPERCCIVRLRFQGWGPPQYYGFSPETRRFVRVDNFLDAHKMTKATAKILARQKTINGFKVEVLSINSPEYARMIIDAATDTGEYVW